MEGTKTQTNSKFKCAVRECCPGCPDCITKLKNAVYDFSDTTDFNLNLIVECDVESRIDFIEAAYDELKKRKLEKTSIKT